MNEQLHTPRTDAWCELSMDGSVLDLAKQFEHELHGLENKYKCAVDMAAIAENKNEELVRQLEEIEVVACELAMCIELCNYGQTCSRKWKEPFKSFVDKLRRILN